VSRWLLLGCCISWSVWAAGPELIDHGRFQQVHLYRPAQDTQQVVLLLSDQQGWQRAEQQQAKAMSANATLVIGIDTPQFLRALETDGGSCTFPDGDLENLSRFVQAYTRQPGYRAPVLMGRGPGAALAYASLAQAPPDLFAAGLVSAFCPVLPLKKPPCAGAGLDTRASPQGAATRLVLQPRPDLAKPFLVLSEAAPNACTAAEVRRFVSAMPTARQVQLPAQGSTLHRALQAALAHLGRGDAAQVAPAALPDLPLVEMPATGETDALAILWSGDGGWADIDKGIARELNAEGVPVVGVDSLRYFWRARTPDGVTRDVERMASHYLAQWHKQRLILLGYSQGADVLPFALNRLRTAQGTRLALTAAIGLSSHAAFEFHLGNWLSASDDGLSTAPEVARIQQQPFLCIYGVDDADAICPHLPAGPATVVRLPGGHHFNDDYRAIAQVILNALPQKPASP